MALCRCLQSIFLNDRVHINAKICFSSQFSNFFRSFRWFSARLQYYFSIMHQRYMYCSHIAIKLLRYYTSCSLCCVASAVLDGLFSCTFSYIQNEGTFHYSNSLLKLYGIFTNSFSMWSEFCQIVCLKHIVIFISWWAGSDSYLDISWYNDD